MIKQMILPILVVYFTNLKGDRGWLLLIGTVILLALLFLFAFLSWKNTFYYVENDILFYEKGILNKSKQGIGIEKITTINENQELIERIFQLSTFKVDAGSTTKGNEIKLTISKKEAETLREKLSKRKQVTNLQVSGASCDSDESSSMTAKTKYHISVKELALYAITSNSFFAGLAFVLAIWQLGQDIPFVKSFMEGPALNRINQYFASNVKGLSIPAIITFVFLVILAYVFFSFIISIILAVVKYYDFTVNRKDDKIEITYGLIDKKNYNLSVDKITALYIKYGLIGQFFKIGALKIESIGYGDEKGEMAILFPLLSDGRRGEILKALLPEYAFEEATCKPPERALKSFVFKYTSFPIFIALILSFAIPYGAFSWLLVLFSGIAGFMNYKKTRVSRTSEQFVMMGGVLGKWIAVIKIPHIQAIITKQSWFQKRKGLIHLEYSYQSNNFGKKLGVQFLDRNEVEEMMEF